MWIIVVMVIAGIIIWAIVSNNSDNQKIREYNLDRGGLKNTYSNFCYLMEKEYSYLLKYDDGRNICYEKIITNNNFEKVTINVGVKLDFSNRAILYSNSVVNGATVKGLEIVNFENEISYLKKSINRSIQGLNISYTYNNESKTYSFANENEAIKENENINDAYDINTAIKYCLDMIKEGYIISPSKIYQHIADLEIAMITLQIRDDVGLLSEMQSQLYNQLKASKAKLLKYQRDLGNLKNYPDL